MRARIGVALALALAAGCSGSNNAAVDADAAADADEVGRGVSRGDAGKPDADAPRADSGAADMPGDDDASEAGAADTDARPDADAVEAATPDADAADAADVAGATDGGDAAETDAAKACTLAAPMLTLPSDPVTGVLSGASKNSLVSCQVLTQTPGSDALFRLEVDTSSLVELVVQSPIDTFLAVRAGCGEDGTELACASTPLDQAPPSGAAGTFGGFAGTFGGFAGSGGPFPIPPPPFDGGAGAGGAGGAAGSGALDAAADATDAAPLRSSGLRVRLMPGTYTIVVDTFDGAGSAPFTLTARAVPAADNATCGTPQIIETSTVVRGKLDLAGPPRVGCSGANNSPLYYAVGVPAGQKLTARVQPLAVGDRAWMPRIEALSSCTQGTACLAQGHAAAGSVQQLDWVNNGTSWRLVTLAVSADSPVNGAQFDLLTSVTDLLATCGKPTALKDGTALFNQDITAAPAPGMQTCGPFSDHAYYYSATVLPQQTLSVTAVGTSSQSPFASPVIVGLRSSCEANTCLPANGNGTNTFQNTSDQTQTILVELSSSGNTFDPRFDLHVSLPLPPAGIAVAPQSGLVTSETGQTATFTVALKSPPTKSVTIPITSDTPSEGTASPAQLVFDPSNWSMPQTVTVTGVDDQLRDGARKYTIVTGAASSGDTRYQGLDAPNVEVTNLDDEPGLFIVGGGSIVTSESGVQATFTVRLNGKPTDTVKVPLSSSDTGEGTVSPAELTFGPDNWNMPQTVTVTGVDDVIVDGVQAYTIVIGTLVSNDASYNGLNPDDIIAHNRDDDFQAVALKLISTDTCSFPSHGGLAIDGFGTLYVVLFCNSQLSVMSSSDGGVTFTSPVVIPDSGDLGGDFALAAGDGGLVHVAFEVPNLGVVLTTSTDAGMTWSQRMLVTPSGGNLRLAAGARTVVVTATSPNGNNSIVVPSVDGGRNFLPARFIDASAIDVSVSPDGQTVWLPELQNNGKLHGSMDAGATLADFGTINLTFGPFVFGKQHIFVNAGSFAQVISLTDTTNVQMIGNTGTTGQSMAITVDSAETATMLNLSVDGQHTEAVRLTGMTASPAKSVAPRADMVVAVPLSPKNVALLMTAGGLTLFTSATFP